MGRHQLYRMDDSELTRDQLIEKYAPPGEGWKYVQHFSNTHVSRWKPGGGYYAIDLGPVVFASTLLRHILASEYQLKLKDLRVSEFGVIHRDTEYALGDKAFVIIDGETRESPHHVGLYFRSILNQD